MMEMELLAWGAISPMGRGDSAIACGGLGARAKTQVARVPWLEEWGLKKPWAALVSDDELRADGDDGPRPREQALLRQAALQLAARLDERLPGWRGLRVALVVGTSSGGNESLLAALERLDSGGPLPPALAQNAMYFSPPRALRSWLRLGDAPLCQPLVACASSTFATGLGCRWLEMGAADLVITGGYDALTSFVAAGFESLRATSNAPPRPFARDREGLCLGEGAALLALARAERASPRGVHILGFGATNDAFHVTAPDPSGSGLARAASAALEDAGVAVGDVSLVSAHATATPFNDAAEMAALRSTGFQDVPIHAFKATIGHSLGAAGALELLAACYSLERGCQPSTPVAGEVEAGLPGRLHREVVSSTGGPILKLSAAFGGANAALVAGYSGGGQPRPLHRVWIGPLGPACEELDLDAVGRAGPLGHVARMQRLDPLSRLVLGATASCVAPLNAAARSNTAVVLATAAATLENDARFDDKRRRLGAQAVDPKRFPPTSPNLAAGQCAIAFGLRGPAIAVGASQSVAAEGLLVAHDLVAGGDAQHCLCVVAEHVGATVRALWAANGWRIPPHGARAVLVSRERIGSELRREPIDERWRWSSAPLGEGSGRRVECGWPGLERVVAAAMVT